jgi:hypothetical protein
LEIIIVIYWWNQERGREKMAKNGGLGNGRIGQVKDRSQFQAPNGNWVKRDTETGRFMDQKTSSETPFKGVRKEK